MMPVSPDNRGQQPVDVAIVPDGPAAWFSTLPIKAMVAALREAGIPGFGFANGWHIRLQPCDVWRAAQAGGLAGGKRRIYPYSLPARAGRGASLAPRAWAAQTVKQALEIAITVALRQAHDIKVVGGGNALTQDITMPEGPEIRRAADSLEAAIKGKPLTDVWFAFPQLKPFESRLIGERVTHVETRGKALLTHFSNQLTLYSHNQLYGVWRVVETGQEPQTTRVLRVKLQTAEKTILLYSASDIEMLMPEQLATHSFLQRVGAGCAGFKPDGRRCQSAVTISKIPQSPVLRAIAGSGVSGGVRELSAG
ncbi:DNA glycosylase/AP lyase Nei [Leclercia adecarboxylata]|uniref:DNA glycosylase/AP lyase Nei n=1 Tax=Leclercia adecarboxylata TaxID=83655 RepID=A0A4U9HM74_9ENTR|nr:DNA glycosylase/AP lyase Nei [Leclercia adecarboxylata]